MSGVRHGLGSGFLRVLRRVRTQWESSRTSCGYADLVAPNLVASYDDEPSLADGCVSRNGLDKTGDVAVGTTQLNVFVSVIAAGVMA